MCLGVAGTQATAETWQSHQRWRNCNAGLHTGLKMHNLPMRLVLFLFAALG